MSTNKKFRIQNGVDVADGGISINDVTVIGADGKVVPAAIADAVAGLTSSDIADLQAQVSAILGTSPETLDTLQEIVTAFENADSTLTQAVADNTTAHTQNASDIAATNARTAGISTDAGSSNIKMTADVDMDGNAVTNMADPSSAQDATTKLYVDTAVQVVTTAVQAEQERAENAEQSNAAAIQSNAAAIQAEESRAQSAEQANASAIQSEQARAETVETDLQMQIDMAAQIRSSAHQDLVDDVNALEFKTFGSTNNGDPEFPTSQLGGGTPTLWGMVSDNTSNIGGLMSSKADKTTVASDIATAKSEAASDASTKADAAEASAKAHADAGDANLQGQIDIIVGSSPASLDTLQEIVTAFENADSTLTGAVAQNASDIASEVSRATTAESGLQAQITSNDGDIASLQALVADLDSDKTVDMTAEIQARIAGDAANSAEVAAEKARAEGVEAGLANDINVETARAVAVEGSLQAQIDSASSAGVNGRQALQAAIDAEEAARIAADAVLQANIDAEASARAGADNTLQSNIDTVSAAVSAITNGSPEQLNQLTELVAAYEAADESLQVVYLP